MSEVRSIRERSRDGNPSVVTLTVTGAVSREEQVDAVDAVEELWRSASRRVLCARFRLETRVHPRRLAIADGILVLEDGRVVCAWSAAGSTDAAVRDVGRRLHARMAARAGRPALTRTA